jgi:hypothetical protein
MFLWHTPTRCQEVSLSRVVVDVARKRGGGGVYLYSVNRGEWNQVSDGARVSLREIALEVTSGSRERDWESESVCVCARESVY